MRRNRIDSDGFTLIELMIVVAIIGVLASLAIYGVARYLKHAKTAEVTRNLGFMEIGEKSQYQLEVPFNGNFNMYVHQFCPNSTALPATLPHAQKIVVPQTAWNDSGWACLKFAISDPQFYQYQHITNGSTGTAANYTAVAYGDLDGNNTASTFQLTGHGGTSGDAVRDTLTVLKEDE